MSVSPVSRPRPNPALDKTIQGIVDLLNQGQLTRAEQQLEATSQLSPQEPRLLGLRARLLHKQEQFEAAIEAYQKALSAMPGQQGLRTNLAACLNRVGRSDEAMVCIDTVLQEVPNRVSALTVKGDIHRQRKEVANALACYRKAIELEPENPLAYRAMAHLTSFSANSPAFRVLKQQLAQDGLSDKERAGLHYALGKAFLDIGEDEQAFSHYRQANDIIDKILPPIQAELERQLRFMRNHFTSALFEQFADAGNQARPQIIVAGMSRSGKSLVESLFHGVKGVTLAGEELTLGRYATDLLEPFEGKLSAYLTQLSEEKVRHDAAGYIQSLGLGQDIKVTTVPGDLWLLGLIGLWTPNVPIIFCVRNLLDLGVTSYFHDYQTPSGYRYSYDLFQVGRQVACSEKVMEHWAQVLPNPVYLVDYEALTRNPEKVMGNLLNDLGLEREINYQEVVGENAELLQEIGPIVSPDVPMPVTDRFNGIGNRFQAYLEPMVEGYKTIVDEFPKLEAATTFLPASFESLREKKDDALPSESINFDWQLPGRVVALDNGCQLLNGANLEELLKLETFTIIAFDPLSEVKLTEAESRHSQLQCFSHAVLGSGKPRTLYACLDASLNSTLEPHADSDNPGAKVLARLPINTVALDDIEGLSGVDWLLLDEKHDNLDILEHGVDSLRDSLLLQISVAFNRTYSKQADLTEVTAWATRNGFAFYRLLDFRHGLVVSLPHELESQPEGTHLLSAQAIFIPNSQRLAMLDDEQRLKLAFLLDTVYHMHDLAYALLREVGEALGERYLTVRGYYDPKREGPPAAMIERAREALVEGHHDKVASHVASWIKKYPACASVWALRGELASWLGLHDQALSYYQKAIALEEDDLSIRLAGLETMLRAGIWWEADKELAALGQHFGGHPVLTRLVWHSLALRPHPSAAAVEEALNTWDEKIAIGNDGEVEAISLKARLLARSGSYDSALSHHLLALEKCENEPAWVKANTHFQRALTLLDMNDNLAACDALWAAVTLRPASYVTKKALLCFSGIISKLDNFETEKKFHQRVRRIIRDYKGEIVLADFDMLRQGLSSARLPGSRMAEVRLEAYNLQRYLPSCDRALDVNAEQGMLLFGLSGWFSEALGLTDTEANMELSKAVLCFTGIQNVTLKQEKLVDHVGGQAAYDLILACGAHVHQHGESSYMLGERLYSLCAPGGIVLLESRGIHSDSQIEEGFNEAASLIEQAGFTCECIGYLCDDGINKREYRILRK